MTPILAMFFLLLTQLTLERQLAEKYCNLDTNVKQSTDFGVSDQKVIPSKHHRVVGKESGQTHAVERLNHTFRQPISRSVRENLSFFKNLENYMGAIGSFIHDDNAQLAKI
jgi:IS1 family transposase